MTTTTETTARTSLPLERAVYVRHADPETFTLFFNGDSKVAEAARQYGSVKPTTDYAHEYRMFVDGRYNFEQVVAFIEGLGTAS